MEDHPRTRKKRQEVKVNRICRIYNINIVSDVRANRKANKQRKTAKNNNIP